MFTEISGYVGETHTIERNGMTITVRIEADDNTPPWEREDGHGPVSEWTTRDKAPGELVLNSDRFSRRYYDFAEACKIARRDGWGLADGMPGNPTKRQIAAQAAREDFERLRRWCNDDWSYIGVVVTVEARGVELGCASLWGIESDNPGYMLQIANECFEEAMDTANMLQVVQIGDRIQFKASCDHKPQWRTVRGRDDLGRPLVYHRGYRDFIVRPEEVRAIQFQVEV